MPVAIAMFMASVGTEAANGVDKEEDGFQIEQRVQDALNGQEADKECCHASICKFRHRDQAQAE